MAGQVLLTISKDEQERARLLSEYKFAVDLQSKMVDARREGVEEGIKEGAEKRAIDMAKNMIKDDEPIEKIVRYTGLARDEVINIMRQLTLQE